MRSEMMQSDDSLTGGRLEREERNLVLFGEAGCAFLPRFYFVSISLNQLSMILNFVFAWAILECIAK